MTLALISTFVLVGMATFFKLVYIHQYSIVGESGLSGGISSFEIQFFKCFFEVVIIVLLNLKFNKIEVYS